jgi:hypothetical protein
MNWHERFLRLRPSRLKQKSCVAISATKIPEMESVANAVNERPSAPKKEWPFARHADKNGAHEWTGK